MNNNLKEFGNGTDGRKLSFFQSSEWMSRIAKKRKYEFPMDGENHPKARLTNTDIKWIREQDATDRMIACKILNICERHWYHIRAGKRWK